MTMTWATASPRERAEIVREEARATPRPLPSDLCRMFSLTPSGLVEILSGADWNERHSASQKAAVRS